MRFKPHVMLFALAVVCLAAVAWAADAPRTASSAPHAAHGQQVAPGAPGDDGPAEEALGDTDDLELDFDALASDDDPGAGAGGQRRVIVRRFMQGGAGGGATGCGPMCCRGMGGPMGGPGMGGPGMGRGGFAGALHALDLTDAQRAKLADIHERQMRRDIQARADLAIARLDLRKAMRAEKPEAFAINAQIDKVARLRTDMAKSHVASLLEARALLTPEQLKKLGEMRAQGPGAGAPGQGGGFGMGPGGRGERGFGHGGPPMHVRIERDTLIRR